MKFRTLFLALAAVLLAPIMAQGQKIASVDLSAVLTGYWRTTQVNQRLQGDFKTYQDELRLLETQYEQMNREHRELKESALSQAVSAEERRRRLEQADGKLEAIQALESRMLTSKEDAERTLTEQRVSARERLTKDIALVVQEIAKGRGIDMVVDAVALSRNELPIFLYVSAEYDLTESTLNQLNKDAPAEFKNPPAATE